MRIFILILSLAATPAFARYQPIQSNRMAFHFGCGNALEGWTASSAARRRQMQRWLGVYLADPSRTLPPAERLASALSEIHDEAVDRLADLPESAYDEYKEYFAETRLAEGRVLTLKEIEEFLLTLNGLQLQLRAHSTLDLGGLPGAAVMLAANSGILSYDNVFIGEINIDDGTDDSAIEPADYRAFTTVEDVTMKLRKRDRVEVVKAAFRPGYRYRREALFDTVERLSRLRDMPRVIEREITELSDLRNDFENNGDDHKGLSATFAKMVDIAREIETYTTLADGMNALNVPILEDLVPHDSN